MMLRIILTYYIDSLSTRWVGYLSLLKNQRRISTSTMFFLENFLLVFLYSFVVLSRNTTEQFVVLCRCWRWRANDELGKDKDVVQVITVTERSSYCVLLLLLLLLVWGKVFLLLASLYKIHTDCLFTTFCSCASCSLHLSVNHFSRFYRVNSGQS